MKKQTGYNLIELMIAITMGLIIIAATISIYVSTIKASADIIKSARLNHDLDSAMALMVNDIRRAGYWGKAVVGSDSSENPFTKNIETEPVTDLQIPSPGCVLYAYDADAKGDKDDNEFYGFRLSNGNIEMRLKGSSTEDCNLDADIWNILNISEGSEQIEVTGLIFSPSYKCLRKRADVADLSYNTSCDLADTAGYIVAGDRAIETRENAITMAGRVKKESAFEKNIMNHVKIRNNRVFVKPEE